VFPSPGPPRTNSTFGLIALRTGRTELESFSIVDGVADFVVNEDAIKRAIPVDDRAKYGRIVPVTVLRANIGYIMTARAISNAKAGYAAISLTAEKKIGCYA
jgi:hypothetical protein